MFSRQQREALRSFIEQSQSLSPDMRHFATSLVTNTLPLLAARPRGGDLEGAVTEMAVHAAVILLCGQHGVLGPLKNLAFSPATMAVRPAGASRRAVTRPVRGNRGACVFPRSPLFSVSPGPSP